MVHGPLLCSRNVANLKFNDLLMFPSTWDLSRGLIFASVFNTIYATFASTFTVYVRYLICYRLLSCLKGEVGICYCQALARNEESKCVLTLDLKGSANVTDILKFCKVLYPLKGLN